jgi:photosystem II stability/assembly factor-like uncharacterized protein
MNDSDFDRDLEADVRAELHRSIVAPPVPEYLRGRIERMPLGEKANGGNAMTAWTGHGLSRAVGLAAALAIVALLGTGLFLRGQNRGGVVPGSTGASASPTAAGSPGPTFPPAPTGQHQMVGGFGWIGGETGFIVVGDRELHLTTDGGITWSEARQLPQSTDLGLTFVDAQHGFTAWTSDDATQTRIIQYRTVDGGKSWQSSTVASLPIEPKTGLVIADYFSDASHGVVLVSRRDESSLGPLGPVVSMTDCLLYSSDNGGVSWSSGSAAPCIGDVGLPNWVSPTTGFIMVSRTPSTVAVTADGGRTWKSGILPGVLSETNVVPRLMIPPDSTGRLRFVGSYWPTSGTWSGEAPLVVFESSDGGASWTEAYRSSGNFVSISAFSADHWVALSGGNTASQLTETRDGGRTWRRIGNWQFSVGAMAWSDEKHGMLQGIVGCPVAPGEACSGTGTVYVTNDGGLTWHQVPF